jgi:RNA polymerase sigma factor (sigma-70 family)
MPLRLAGDERLAKLAAEGDQRAFTAIYERHSRGLYRYILSILRNAEDANDAVQGTMMKALLAIPAKRAEVPLRPWLYRIAHNEAISVQRRQSSHGVLSEDAAGAGPDAHDEWADRDDLKQLVTDLLELPERQRSALVMRELSGLEYEEIGLSLGTSSAGAKQTVYEARIALYERAQGRELACARVRRELSTGDRRVLRGRRIAAHLRNCATCGEFQASLTSRGKALAALAPAAPGLGAVGLLKALLGGGGGGGGSGGGAGVLAGMSGGGGSAITAAAAVKGAATAMAVLMIANGGVPLPDGGGGGSARADRGDVTQVAPTGQTDRASQLVSVLREAPRLSTTRGGVHAVLRRLANADAGRSRAGSLPTADVAEGTPAELPAAIENALATAPPSTASPAAPAPPVPASVEHPHTTLLDVEPPPPAVPPSGAPAPAPAPTDQVTQPEVAPAPPETLHAVPGDLVRNGSGRPAHELDGTRGDNGLHLGLGRDGVEDPAVLPGLTN